MVGEGVRKIIVKSAERHKMFVVAYHIQRNRKTEEWCIIWYRVGVYLWRYRGSVATPHNSGVVMRQPRSEQVVRCTAIALSENIITYYYINIIIEY